MESRDRSAPPVTRPPRVTAWRVRLAAWSAVLSALAFIQTPGRIVADTKLDLAIEPGAFLLRALHLWDASGAFGQVQESAYGYLFPLGPFFWLGSLMHIPPWAVKRLWWALVLVVSFLGVVKLLGVLRVGAPWARIVAGLAFSLSPRMLSVLGPSSIEVWPSALAPSVAVVPLVIATQQGDPRRGAASPPSRLPWSVASMSVATFAVIPLAAWWIATSPRGPRRRSLMIWWPPLVLMGTAWWLPCSCWVSTAHHSWTTSSPFRTHRSPRPRSMRSVARPTGCPMSRGSSAGQLLIGEPVLITNGDSARLRAVRTSAGRLPWGAVSSFRRVFAG